MNTTKKLFILVMVALMAAVSVMPSTFSWYSHNGSAQGDYIHYNDSFGLSIKSTGNTLSMSTKKTDEKGNTEDSSGNAYGNVPAGVSVAAGKYQYYKTTIQNSGDNDVNVDLNTTGLDNNADFYIGTVSPTLNEKAYAAKPSRVKKSTGYVRVYFKTRNSYSDFWNQGKYRGASSNNSLDTSHSPGSSNTTSCDMNIAYKADSVAANFDGETLDRLYRCTNTDSTSDTGTDRVFYYDLPADTEYFYFFNHWYLHAATDREWNRTIDINDLSAGRLYYLTGNKVDEKWKEYKVRDIDTNLVACDNYYSSVQMSLGNSVFADIGLKKESEDGDEDFTPEYYGSSIKYTSEDRSIATVDNDGRITPVASGSTTITTKITGRYGDYKEYTTNVNIPSTISEVPILKNILVEADDKVDIYWYAVNRGSSNMTTDSIFFTN